MAQFQINTNKHSQKIMNFKLQCSTYMLSKLEQVEQFQLSICHNTQNLYYKFVIMRFLLVLCLAFHSFSLFCDKPQRVGWISFEAFSAMDHIAQIFEQINHQKLNKSYTTVVDGVTYEANNLIISAWYNDAAQKESFLNETTAKVTCGQLTISFQFTYKYADKSGTASGHVAADPIQFTKESILIDGVLAWDLKTLTSIKVSDKIVIQRSNPTLGQKQKQIFQSILNQDSEHPIDFFSSLVKSLSTQFQDKLRKFLNRQHIVVITNSKYTYGNITINYTSVVVQQKLTNVGFKGLKYSSLFQLQNYTSQCVNMPTNYLSEYGGLQQMIAYPWIRANLQYIARNGFFTTSLTNQKWQTSVFQFYMGDVANFISEAKKISPSTPITGNCQWNSKRKQQTFVQMFTSSSVYVSVPLVCVFQTANETIQTLTFDLITVVSLQLTKKYLSSKITSASADNIAFESAGSYVVTQKEIASYIVKDVLKKLVGQTTFGNGFQTTQRKAPSLRVKSDYIVMYDASQP